MCGIAGFYRSLNKNLNQADLQRMGDVICHRGPDASGVYLDDTIGLAHRRLSILDLSEQGNQPMFSADRRLVIVLNGEIYNFLELRAQLEKEGFFFHTGTDTEVLLALYQKDGPACLAQLNGMFAFAVWDTVAKTLFLARDRIGKKPLYYFHAGGDCLAFASEIKALLQLPCIPRDLEPTALADFFKYLYVPAPKTIFRNIYKLLPGHSLMLSSGGSPCIEQYWDVDFSKKTSLSYAEAEEALLELLQKSTACRMIADVPLGAFLSGGVDSSAIVALMAKASSEPVRTCSIGFSDKRHDETPYAREVAELFATNHKEYQVQTDIAATVALMPKFFDEPFADSSSIPTYHVSRLARQAVTVALAGDGGDESFAGYGKYGIELTEDFVRHTIPRPILSGLNRLTRPWSHPVARKLRSLTDSAQREPARAFYHTNTFIDDQVLNQFLADPIRRECSGYDPAEITTKHWHHLNGADHTDCMLYTDLKTYLPDDILVKVDRMSMAHSLEVRAPFLDYRILDFAASLPRQWKIQGNNKKIILRKTFSRILPQNILNRRKQGFTVPLDTWFRNQLKDFSAAALLNNNQLSEFINPQTIQQLWQEHQSKKADHGTLLWSALMFALWRKEYLE